MKPRLSTAADQVLIHDTEQLSVLTEGGFHLRFLCRLYRVRGGGGGGGGGGIRGGRGGGGRGGGGSERRVGLGGEGAGRGEGADQVGDGVGHRGDGAGHGGDIAGHGADGVKLADDGTGHGVDRAGQGRAAAAESGGRPSRPGFVWQLGSRLEAKDFMNIWYFSTVFRWGLVLIDVKVLKLDKTMLMLVENAADLSEAIQLFDYITLI